MEAIYLFIILVIGLTIGFAMLLGNSSTNDVISHWSDRRCDFDILLSSYRYKPADDSRSAFEFSADNFKFCISSKAIDYLNTLFGALFEILRKQMGAADVMTSVMKTLRTQLNTIFQPFQKLMAKFWNKFKQIGSLASRIFQHLFMSMKKAAATAVASIFVAISLQTAFLNTIDFLIKVIMIVLYILIALAIIFFLPILPVLALVIITVSGIESALPGSTGTMGTVFNACFLNTTQIIMKDSTTKTIDRIQLGDVLLNGQIVESVIEIPGSSGLYMIDGIYVTGDHRIWDTKKKKWIFVEDSPKASITVKSADTLWTLITSDRTIPIMGKVESHRFADWEEIEDSEISSKLWDTLVREILESSEEHPSVPENPPCLDKSFYVKHQNGKWVPLSSIKKGDILRDGTEWTTVIGICHRTVSGGIGKEGSRLTSGVWIKNKYGKWTHPTGKDDSIPWVGMTLLTSSGTFQIMDRNHRVYSVRDFTEVGLDRLPDTYTRIESVMKDLE